MAKKELLQNAVVFLEENFSKAVSVAKEKPHFLLGGVVAVLFFYFFWRHILVILFLVLLSLVVIKLKYPEKEEKNLLQKQSLLEEELRIAEQKLLQHKIELKDYQEIVDNAQKQLVEIEALLSKKDFLQPKNIEGMGSKRKHLLKQLFAKKGLILETMKIAEKKYFKRRINGLTYKEILAQKQKELIFLEAEIKKAIAQESVDVIKKELSLKLKKFDESDEKKRESDIEQLLSDLSIQEEKELSEEGQQQ